MGMSKHRQMSAQSQTGVAASHVHTGSSANFLGAHTTKSVAGTHSPGCPQEPPSGRYYAAFWHTTINDAVNVFACTWCERGIWTLRTRFRYSTDLRREGRYEVRNLLGSEAQVMANVFEGMQRANVLGGPVSVVSVKGGPERALRVLSDQNLFDDAWDDVTLPILYNSTAHSVALAHVMRTQGKPTEQDQAQLEREVATHARLAEWDPRLLSFWTLGLRAPLADEDGAVSPQWMAQIEQIRNARRETEQWLQEKLQR